MDAHSRRTAALAAIQQTLEGVRPAELESDLLDFKEELGSHRSGRRQPISSRHEPAARALAEAAACFANSSAGGMLVVGVDDKASGPSAFVGAYLDTVWLRERIYALTLPHLAVDIIEELTVAGHQIYLINIAPALEEVRCDGKLRARIGTRCEELSGDQARRLLEERRRYDWSAEPSPFRLSNAVPAAMEIARRYYEEEHSRVPHSNEALVSQLGLHAGDTHSDDPALNNAGALLLCRYEPGTPLLDVMATRVEGVVSRRRLERGAPLLVGFEEAWQFLLDCFPAQPVILGLLRRELRSLPQRAFREALVNAVMHRDYRQVRGRIIVQAIGQPATTLKVRSPGGFPPGVQPDRLLATPSKPRNPALAHALHLLGLAEREGIGIDTMYLDMLRDGHAEPTILEDGGDVLCILSGGQVDLEVRSFFDDFAKTAPGLEGNVRAYLAVSRLCKTAILRPGELAEVAQCTYDEARDVLERLGSAGITERLLDRSWSFRMAKPARERLRHRLAYTPHTVLEDRWEMLRAYLDSHDDISREEVAALLNLSQNQALRTLSELVNERGLLSPVGKARGRGVRYRLSSDPSSPGL